ncbi:apoptosis-inducing factor 2, partial [Phenoliferia sp. Uapishka_3]
MWSHLHVTSENELNQILQSPARGRFTTEELRIWAGAGSDWDDSLWNDDMEALVEGLNGLKVIEVKRYPESDGDLDGMCEWIGSDNLKDLKTLRIDMPFDREFVHETPPVKFQLSCLDIGDHVDSHTFIKSIFTASAKTLTSLTLEFPSMVHKVLIDTCLPLIKDTLQSLHLIGGLPGIEVHLPTYLALERLTIFLLVSDLGDSINPHVDDMFRNLPPSSIHLGLSLLGPEEEINDQAREILLRLEEGREGWGRLSVLKCREKMAFGECGYHHRTEMREICKKKGITLKQGWEEKVTTPLDSVFPAGTRHLLLTNHRAVQLSARKVILDPPMEIEFAYAFIATGSTYDFPCRPKEGTLTAATMKDYLRSMQAELSEATSVLIVGGGPAGVEAAGEIASKYPDKTVTLLHSRAKLFENFAVKFGALLVSQLEAKGVDIHYNCRLSLGDLKTGKIEEQTFTLPDGATLRADFIFVAFGCKPNSKLISTLGSRLLDAGGYVSVKTTMQLDASAEGASAESLEHIFAPGDVNSLPMNLAGAAVRQSSVAVANILSLIASQSTGLKTYWGPSGPWQSISVGPNGGASQNLGFVLGSWIVAPFFSRNLGTRQFQRAYNF